MKAKTSGLKELLGKLGVMAYGCNGGRMKGKKFRD
jgi:hypothetical protein